MMDVTIPDTNLLLNALIEDSPDLYAALDKDGHFLAFNQRYAHEFKEVYGQQPAVGENAFEIISHLPEEQKRIMVLWNKVLEGHPMTMTESFGDEGLTRKTFEIKFRPLIGKKGEIIGAYHVLRDITKEKTTEKQLIQSESQFKAFFHSAPIMMGIVELTDNDILHVQDNDMTAAFFGLPKGSTINKLSSEMGTPTEVIKHWRYHYLKSKETRSPERFEYWHGKPYQGKHLTVVVTFIGKATSGNEQYSYIIEDTTHQKMIEHELRMGKQELEARVEQRTQELLNTQRQLSDSFEKVAIGIAHLSLDGTFIKVNPRVLSITGLAREELLGRSFCEITYPEDITAERELMEKILNGQISEYSLEKRLFKKDGHLLWVRQQVTLNFDFKGKPLYFIASIEDISETKSLLTEQNRLYELPNHLLCVLDEESRFKRVNAGFEHVLGYSADELVGRSLWDFIHPDDLGVSVATQQIGHKTIINGFENRFCDKQGKYHWLRWTGTLVDGLNYGAAVDVTKEKIAQETMANQQKWLEKILNELPVPIALIRARDGSLDFANRAAKEQALRIPELIRPEDEQSFYATTPDGVRIPREKLPRFKVSNGEDIPATELIWHTPEGNAHLLIHGRYLPASDAHEAIGIISIMNITEQKMAQAELQRTSELLDSLMRSSSDIIYIKDRASRMIYCNPNTLRLIGISEKELYGKTDEEFLGPGRGGEEIWITDNRIMSSGVGETTEEWVTWKNGERRLYMSRKEPYRDQQGKVIGLLGISRDITDLKQVQMELEKAVKARDEFLSIASHELKTPISSLKLQAQLVKRQRERGDTSIYTPLKVDRLVDQIEKQVERIVRLVDDMLDIGRIRTGKLSIHRGPVAFCMLVQEVLDRLGPNLKEAGINTNFYCNEKLKINGDRIRLEQVVTNLLTNAMKYGEKSPIEIRLGLSPDSNKMIRLCVVDQGKGISPEAQERIFNRFEREVNPSEVSGLGLGLYITKEIVEAHEGKIWVESDGLGKGSAFIVELPLLQESLDNYSQQGAGAEDGKETSFK